MNADESLPGGEEPDLLADIGSSDELDDATLAGIPVEVRQKAQEKADKKKKKKGQKKPVQRTPRGVETMFRSSYRTHMTLSGIADQKANIMISINGLMLTIILASISPMINSDPWLLLPTSVMLIGCAISMVYAVFSARPRVTKQTITMEDVRERRANILFFGTFVQLSEEEYAVGMEDLLADPVSVYRHMIRDLYALGKVLSRKFALLRVSYDVFMIGVSLSILLYLIVFSGVLQGPASPGGVNF